MADVTVKKASELGAATLSASTRFVVSDTDDSDVLKKTSLLAIQNNVAQTRTFTGLETDTKTLVGAINEINTSLSDKSGTLAVEAVTKSDLSIAASTNGVADFTCSKSGYTLLACAGFKVVNSSSSGVNSSMINVYAAYKYSNTVCRVLYRNTSTSAAKADIAVYALFVKD